MDEDNIIRRHPRVPVIGLQQRQVKHCDIRIMEVMMCDCGSPDPVVIPGIDRAGFCPKCKQKFVISKVEFNNTGGNVSVAVQVSKWNGPMSASRELEVGIDASPESGRNM